MKRTVQFLLTWVITLAGCQAHHTTVASQPVPTPTASKPAIDSLGEMSAPSTRPVAGLDPETFDYRSLIGDPPADDSAAHRAELELMLKLQADRTPADEKRSQEEVAVTVFGFSNVLGSWFNPDDLPFTTQIMKEAGQQAKIVSGGGKKIWSRVRPPAADSRIHPCVPLEKTFSYPSGHATVGAFWAGMLAEMFPDDRDMLVARGMQIGFDRTMAGMHWPSDIIAGNKVGTEAAKRLIADPAFHAKLVKAKAECLAAMARATTRKSVKGGSTLPSMRSTSDAKDPIPTSSR